MLHTLISMTRQKAIFPFYHAVSDTNPIHIKHLYQVRGIHQFEKDIHFFLKHYQPMRLDDVFNFVKDKKRISKPGFFITFDDGLREVYDNIYPILKKYDIGAAIFLNSSFTDNKGLFFRYKASLLVEKIIKNPAFKGSKDVVKWSMDQRISSVEKAILSVNYQEKGRLDTLAEIIDLDFEKYLSECRPYMDSEQITELSKNGFCIGGHSKDHPLFSTLTADEQIRQAKVSTDWVHEKWPSTYSLFAFPFTDYGVNNSFFDNASYDISFGTAGLKNDSIHNHIQRIPIENYPYSAASIVIREYFYYMLKSIIGKNTIKRE